MNATTELTIEQLKLVLGEIASVALSARALAMLLNTDHEMSEMHEAAVVHGIEMMVTTIGFLADEASDANVLGGHLEWLCGPRFDKPGRSS